MFCLCVLIQYGLGVIRLQEWLHRICNYPRQETFVLLIASELSLSISLAGNDDRILLIARYDNLGKGASGAAVECMNIKMGTDKTKGLQL